jgi:predicted amidophosphoribosyltransferase
MRNPEFGALDGRLLDFKEGKRYAIRAEAQEFSAALSQLELPEQVLIVVVPGHEARETNVDTPLAKVAEMIAAAERRFIASVDTLIRIKDIDKLASGGDRSVLVHLESIDVREPTVVKGQTVMVLDDITTTGNSMKAVRRLLSQAGAARIAGIAIGRTAG